VKLIREFLRVERDFLVVPESKIEKPDWIDRPAA